MENHPAEENSQLADKVARPTKTQEKTRSSEDAFRDLLEAKKPKSVSPSSIEYLLRVGDLLSIFLTGIFVLAFYSSHIGEPNIPQYSNIIVIGAILASLFIFTSGGYDTGIFFNLSRSLRSAVLGWALSLVTLLMVGFAFKMTGDFSRAWAGSWAIISTSTIIVTRTVVFLIALSMRRKGRFNSRTIILGADTQGQKLAQFLMRNRWLTIDILAFVDDRTDRAPETFDGIPVLNGTDKLIELIRHEKIDQVLVALPWQASHRLRHIVELIAETPIKIRLAPDLAMYDFLNRSFTSLGGLPVLDIFDRPISGINSLTKRLEDLSLGLVFTLLATPILLFAAIAIKLDSRGPVFFRQAREGFNNKPFYIWKFRTMRHDKCETDGISQATKDDARITRLGAFLRKTSIDELPQLFNVLAGDMSIVGPRPHAASTKAAGIPFENAVSRYAARHNVKPGITGWAQVKGWRGETDTVDKLEQRLQHDLYYIDHWSLGLDISIILRTMLVVLWQKEAY